MNIQARIRQFTEQWLNGGATVDDVLKVMNEVGDVYFTIVLSGWPIGNVPSQLGEIVSDEFDLEVRIEWVF